MKTYLVWYRSGINCIEAISLEESSHIEYVLKGFIRRDREDEQCSFHGGHSPI